MLYIIKFLYKTFLLPPGIIIFLLILYSVYLYRKKNKAYKGIAIIAAVFYLFSISLVSDFFINKLQTKYTPPSNASGDAIIMLGGGANLDTPSLNGKGNLSGYSSNRLLTCAQLYNKLHVPIIVSGGQVYSFGGNEAEIAKRIFMNLGVNPNDIIVDTKSLNTEQNAINTAKILKAKGFYNPILVTSAFHMERSVLFFKKNKVNVTPYPCDYKANINEKVTVEDFIPDSDALNNLSISIKEYIGIIPASL